MYSKISALHYLTTCVQSPSYTQSLKIPKAIIFENYDISDQRGIHDCMYSYRPDVLAGSQVWSPNAHHVHGHGQLMNYVSSFAKRIEVELNQTHDSGLKPDHRSPVSEWDPPAQTSHQPLTDSQTWGMHMQILLIKTTHRALAPHIF